MPKTLWNLSSNLWCFQSWGPARHVYKPGFGMHFMLLNSPHLKHPTAHRVNVDFQVKMCCDHRCTDRKLSLRAYITCHPNACGRAMTSISCPRVWLASTTLPLKDRNRGAHLAQAENGNRGQGNIPACMEMIHWRKTHPGFTGGFTSGEDDKKAGIWSTAPSRHKLPAEGPGPAALLGTWGWGRIGSWLWPSALWTPQTLLNYSCWGFLAELWHFCFSDCSGVAWNRHKSGAEAASQGQVSAWCQSALTVWLQGNHTRTARPTDLWKCISLFSKCVLSDKKMSCGRKWDFPLEVLLHRIIE